MSKQIRRVVALVVLAALTCASLMGCGAYGSKSDTQPAASSSAPMMKADSAAGDTAK